jgi:MraZ protein
MFFGKCTLPLREKSQLTLPGNYRGGMSKTAYLTQGFDRNLFLLSQEAFNTICTHVQATSISDPLSRLLRRLFLGGAVEIAIDDAGQIEIPADLCEYAELGEEITIVGQGEYSEIWAPALWQKQMDSMNDHEANAHRFDKFNLSLSDRLTGSKTDLHQYGKPGELP